VPNGIGKRRRRERSPISPAMIARRVLPAGFIEPYIPVLAVKPPAGPQWVHEIKHDGYRLIVRRDGAMVRPTASPSIVKLSALMLAAARPAQGHGQNPKTRNEGDPNLTGALSRRCAFLLVARR
jgi:hypothetical protein